MSDATFFLCTTIAFLVTTGFFAAMSVRLKDELDIEKMKHSCTMRYLKARMGAMAVESQEGAG